MESCWRRGAGAYTLCYTCNSEISGNRYVAELKRWTSIGMAIVARIAGGAEGNAVELKLHRVYPARILKQIVVMLASANPAALLDHHRALREYAINPHPVCLRVTSSTCWSRTPTVRLQGMPVFPPD